MHFFADIISYSMACLLIFLTLPFVEQNFYLTEVQLINHFFYGSCLFFIFKKSLSYPGSSRFFFSVLSFGSFIALHFEFRFLILCELTFVKYIISVSRLIFFMWRSRCSCTICQRQDFNFTHVLCQWGQVSQCCSTPSRPILGPSLEEGKDWQEEKLIRREARNVP